MSSIALKNVLRNMYGQLEQHDIFRDLIDMNKISKEEKNKFELFCQMCINDLEYYRREMIRIEDMLCGDDKSKFNLLYNKELNYTVPLACQGSFVLKYDLKGKLIQNVKKDVEYLQFMNIAILPLKGKSIVLVFTHENNIDYEVFLKQFAFRSEDEQLKIINYLIFKYTDNYFISNKIDEKMYISEFIKICTPKEEDFFEKTCDISEQEIWNEVNICPNFLKMDVTYL